VVAIAIIHDIDHRYHRSTGVEGVALT